MVAVCEPHLTDHPDCDHLEQYFNMLTFLWLADIILLISQVNWDI